MPKSIDSNVSFETERLVLRDFVLKDLEVLQYWFASGHPWQELDAPYFKRSQKDADAFIEAIRDRISKRSWTQPRSRLAIVLKETGELIGSVNSYWESIETNWLSAGICIYDDRYWGRGYGYEALKSWVNYLFDSHEDIVRLDLRTWSGNQGMIALARKLGFVQEACFRNARIVNGQYFDSIGLGILRHEWNSSV